METLQEWLKKKIEEKGIGITQLSFETGLSRAIIYYYFSDVNRPKRDNLKKICDVLGADLEEALALYTPKRVGRPIGSVKKWGAETFLENLQTDNPTDSNKLPEYTTV